MDVELTGASPAEVRAALALGIEVTPDVAVGLADAWLVADLDHPAVVDLAIGRGGLEAAIDALVPATPDRTAALGALVHLVLRQWRTGTLPADAAGRRLAVLLRHLVGAVPLPDERLLRRLGAADAAVLEALDAAWSGRPAMSGAVELDPEAPVDADEAARRLLVAATGFAWEASSHHDRSCGGSYSDVAALATWVGADLDRLDPLVPAVESLLDVGTRDGRTLVVVGFLEDLQNVLLRTAVPLDAARSRLGPRGRTGWDDLIAFWSGGPSSGP